MSSQQVDTLPQRSTIIMNRELKQEPNHLSMPISYIIVVGTPTTEESGVFHFHMSLVHSDSTKGMSISLDNRPSFTDMNHMSRGVVLVEFLTYGDSNDAGPAPAPFKVDICQRVTASQICDALFNAPRLDQYDFTNEGQGCRHWCAVALETLALSGFISNSVEDNYRAWEVQQAAKFGARFPMPRIQGSFYTL